jgi:hypothetical protein
VPQPTLTMESDKDDIGKGIWATQIYPTSWDVAFPWEAYLTSQNAAEICSFALGKVVETAVGVGGAKYVITPLDNNIDCLHDMPSATYMTQIASCSQTVVDTALIGVCCEDFTVRLASGVGRANATIASNWVGTGDFQSPSAITMPVFATENTLNSGGAVTITISGTDYIVNHMFVSCDIGYKNNIKLDQGFFPGSGSVNGAAIRGRMRRGVPNVTLNFVSEFEHDSTELDKFLALTEGAATITLEGQVLGAGPDKHALTFKFARVIFRAAVIGENDNTLTINVECEVLQHTNGQILEIDVTTSQAGIMTASAAVPVVLDEGQTTFSRFTGGYDPLKAFQFAEDLPKMPPPAPGRGGVRPHV